MIKKVKVDIEETIKVDIGRYKVVIEKYIKDNSLKNIIEAIFLYGSYATNNANVHSDVDIFILTRYKIDEKDEDKINKMLESIFNNKVLDFSIYSKSKFQNQLESGSLFLHHLKNESKLVYSYEDREKQYYFNNLTDFKGLTEDICLYSRMLKKTQESINKNGINYFDLCILGVIARNTLTIISYNEYKNNCKFGKYEVFDIVKDENINFSNKDYDTLLNYRSFYNRNEPKIELPKNNEIEDLIDNLDDLILYSMNKIGIIDTVDRVYHLLNLNNSLNLYTSFELFTDFERDVFIYLKKYISKKYDKELTSLRKEYIEKISKKYIGDKFIEATYRIIKHIEKIKTYSNNYSIEFSEISDSYINNHRGLKIKELIYKFIKKLNLLLKNKYCWLKKLEESLEYKKENTFEEDLKIYIDLKNDFKNF